MVGIPVRGVTDDEGWTSTDRKMEARAKDLLDQGQVPDAEKLSREVLDRHLQSPTALIDHVEMLNALRRYAEALEECRKVVALDPENAVAKQWLGVLLCRSAHYAEAIPMLEQALKTDSTEDTSLWLAEAYLQIGNKERSRAILTSMLVGLTKDDRLGLMTRIGFFFYEIGDAEAALLWWQRSADAGDKSAAHWLSWAYTNGYGVVSDDGASAHWERIAEDDQYSWLPRLPFADAFMKAVDGWGLVLVALLAAAILPVPTIVGVGCCFCWRLTKDPAMHWTERARRSYPFQAYLMSCSLLLPWLFAAAAFNYPGFALPVSKWLLFWAVWAICLVACHTMAVFWERRYQTAPATVRQSLQNTLCILYIYGVSLTIFIIMARNLPSHWGWRALLVVTATILAYFWIQFGGWIRLGRWVGMISPADQELTEMVAALALKRGHPKPVVWRFHWHKANALAFIFSNEILVTEKLCTLVSRDELKAVLAHELAHLCEDRTTKLMRLLTPLLLLPLFMIGLLWPVLGLPGLASCYCLLILGLRLLRQRARRMEERADAFGSEAQENEGVYARALEKLYEANLMPAVMPGKKAIHPHLYDRLVAAGLTPDYPRPKPPGRWGSLAALLVLGLNALGLSAIWLLLF